LQEIVDWLGSQKMIHLAVIEEVTPNRHRRQESTLTLESGAIEIFLESLGMESRRKRDNHRVNGRCQGRSIACRAGVHKRFVVRIGVHRTVLCRVTILGEAYFSGAVEKLRRVWAACTVGEKGMLLLSANVGWRLLVPLLPLLKMLLGRLTGVRGMFGCGGWGEKKLESVLCDGKKCRQLLYWYYSLTLDSCLKGALGREYVQTQR
jgi:hypothetical protein